MKIPIREYVITSDSLCITLNEKKKVQKGEGQEMNFSQPELDIKNNYIRESVTDSLKHKCEIKKIGVDKP